MRHLLLLLISCGSRPCEPEPCWPPQAKVTWCACGARLCSACAKDTADEAHRYVFDCQQEAVGWPQCSP